MEKVAVESGDSFPAKFRIKKSADFRKVFSLGEKSYSPNFVLYKKPNSFGFPRLGITVGRRVSPSSVRRNRMKRVLREIFRKNKSFFSSNDVVFLVKNDILEKRFSELLPEIEKLTRERGRDERKSSG